MLFVAVLILSLVPLVFLSKEKCNLFAFLGNSDLPVFYLNIFPHFFGDLLSFLKLKTRAADSSCPFQSIFLLLNISWIKPCPFIPLPQWRWHSQYLIWCSIQMVHAWSLFPYVVRSIVLNLVLSCLWHA